MLNIRGTEALVPGTEAIILGTEALVPGTKALDPGTKALVPGTKALVHGTKALVHGTNAFIPVRMPSLELSFSSTQKSARIFEISGAKLQLSTGLLVMRRIGHAEPAATTFPKITLDQPIAAAEIHICINTRRRLILKMSKCPCAFVSVLSTAAVIPGIEIRIGCRFLKLV